MTQHQALFGSSSRYAVRDESRPKGYFKNSSRRLHKFSCSVNNVRGAPVVVAKRLILIYKQIHRLHMYLHRVQGFRLNTTAPTERFYMWCCGGSGLAGDRDACEGIAEYTHIRLRCLLRRVGYFPLLFVCRSPQMMHRRWASYIHTCGTFAPT